ncbi:hypothetical protein TWF281_003611 [Arthrobotrys megalospora]
MATVVVQPPPQPIGLDGPVPSSPRSATTVTETMDIATLLGPGKDVEDLATLGDDFASTIDSFNALLQFPNLDKMIASITETDDKDNNPVDPENKKKVDIKNLKTFIVSAQGQFNVFSQQDVSISRNIGSFAKAVRFALMKAKSPAEYATRFGLMIEKNAEDAGKKASQKKAVLRKLNDFLSQIGAVISTTQSKMKSLTKKIESADESIDNDNMLDTLGTLLQDIFQLAKDPVGKGMQLAGLLSQAGDMNTSFKEKLKDKEQRKQLVAGLTKLQSSLGQLVALLDRLEASLPKAIDASAKLTGIWNYASKNLEKAKTEVDPLSDLDIESVVGAWQSAAEAAQSFQDSLIGADAKGLKAMSFGVKALAEPDNFPTSDAEIEAFDMMDQLDGRRYPLAHRLKVASRPAVANRLREKLAAKVATAAGVDPEKQKQAQKALSAPEVQSVLDELNGNVTGMIQKFKDMLQAPNLSSIAIPNPFRKAVVATMSNGLLPHLDMDVEANEEATVAIDVLIRRFQTMYQQLQGDIVPIARNLITYATIQINVIPKLTPNEPTATEMTIDKYLDINRKVVEEHKKAVDGLANRMLEFQNSWQNAINALEATLAEQKQKIEQAKDQIAKLQEEQKKKTLWGVLELIGAVICITVAALVPGVGLLGAPAAIGFLTAGVNDLIQSRKLGPAMQELQNQIAVADKIKTTLEIIIPQAKELLASLKNMTGVWFQIAQNLNDISAFMLQGDLFDLIRDEVVESWKNIQRLVQETTAIIAEQGGLN